jgi:predicted NUDIX family NTP pyrophosphohydrolase
MQYQIKVKGDPEEKLRQARKIAAEQGVTFVGDGTSGKFSGKILGGRLIGTYAVTDGILLVTITEKPFLTSWSMIESQLKEFLRS